MKRILLLAAISFTIACNNNESEGQLNTPPTAATDTAGGANIDTSNTAADTLSGTPGTGQDSVR